jgi:flagellar motor switch protein FliM
MSPDNEPQEPDAGARRLSGAIHEHSGFAVERLPGLAAALDRFIAELPRFLAPLLPGYFGPGAFEGVRATSLFQAIADCAGLTAAIYANAETEARLLIALDERIDDLIIAAIFGQSVSSHLDGDPASEAPRSRTLIEAALVEEFGRALGRALQKAFASLAPLELAFERLIPLNDTFALGRRDMPAAATRFSLPTPEGVFEGLLLLPQPLLMPLRKELGVDHTAEAPAADRRWSRLLETGVKQTRLPVSAVLEDVPMSLGQVACLRVGGILPLQSNDFEGVRLECSGRGIFLCKLGQGEGRYRLEIKSPIPHEPEEATH